ncbi:MAG: PAS domain-containing protein, partial [Myxococcales bacterium]|nr:PAS domain-containing protein [Myxococcales bacterium]
MQLHTLEGAGWRARARDRGPGGRPLASTPYASMSGRDAAFLSAVIGAVAHPVYVTDRRGRLVLVNAALERLLGRDAAQMLGKTLGDALGPD